MGKSPLSGYRTGERAVSLKKETFRKHYWVQKKKLLNYYCRMIHPTGAHRYWKPMWTSCLQDIPMECNSESAVKTSNGRSEEHTSELQSRENLVCRLLLE